MEEVLVMEEGRDPEERTRMGIPIVINTTMIEEVRDLNPIMRAQSYNFPDAVLRMAHLGRCDEPVNGGTTWHTHPLNLGPDLANEDIWYVLQGRGTMYYKRSGDLKSMEFRKGDMVHSKHLTNYTFNTGDELLIIPMFGVPRPPWRDKIIYENFIGFRAGNIPEEARPLDPPVLIHEDDVKPIYPFPEGKAAIRPLITPKTAGSQNANAGIFVAEPGQGSDWHTHPFDVWKGFAEEDLSYVISGIGTLYYRLNSKEYEIPLGEGDMIFTGHLPHCIRNTGSEKLILFSGLAPNRRATEGIIPEICP